MVCVELVACTPFASATVTPAPIVVATVPPPTLLASPQLSGRLLFDFALGELWSVELRTGNATRVHTKAQVFPIQPSSPMNSVSDTLIAYAGTAFSGDGVTGRFGIYLRDQLLLPPHDGLSYQDPTWSSDAKNLFVTRVGVAPDTQITGTSGLAIQSVNIGMPLSPTTVVTNAFQPAPSPDGLRLAYIHIDVTSPFSQTRSLRVRNLDTGDDHEVLSGQAFSDVYGPRWLNDQELVFAAVQSPLLSRGHTSKPDGDGDAVNVLVDAVLGHDVAHAHSWVGNVWAVNTNSGQLTRLTPQTFMAPIVAPSPDGRFVAVMAMDGIWIMKADGTALRRISDDGSSGSIQWVN